MGNGEFVGLHLQIVIQQDVYVDATVMVLPSRGLDCTPQLDFYFLGETQYFERLERDLISTRTNIQSLLGDHEYHGHYKKNWKHNKNSFDPTYHYQTRTMKSRFMKTTHKFREYVKSVIKENKYGL